MKTNCSHSALWFFRFVWVALVLWCSLCINSHTADIIWACHAIVLMTCPNECLPSRYLWVWPVAKRIKVALFLIIVAFLYTCKTRRILTRKQGYECEWRINTLTMLFSEHWNCNVAIKTWIVYRYLRQKETWSKPSRKRRPCRIHLTANHLHENLETTSISMQKWRI